MKITPIEIRQHTFEKKSFGGYRPDEVDTFLSSLSQEWERVLSETKMLKMQLELAEKELHKLKEIELTLFKTLKTAEDTSSQITEQANRAAEHYLSESRKMADEILADARKRSTVMVQDAENQARYIKENILSDLKAMDHDFKAMEKYKESLILQIRTLANNAVDSVERFERKFNRQSLKAKIEEVSTQATLTTAHRPTDEIDPSDQEATETVETATVNSIDPVTAQAAEAGLPITEAEEQEVAIAETETSENELKNRKGTGSFFDQI